MDGDGKWENLVSALFPVRGRDCGSWQIRISCFVFLEKCSAPALSDMIKIAPGYKTANNLDQSIFESRVYRYPN